MKRFLILVLALLLLLPCAAAGAAFAEGAPTTTEQANWFTDLKDQFVLNFIDGDRWEFILEGLLNTLLLTLFSALIGVVLGVVVAAVRTTYDNNLESMKKNKGVGYYLFAFVNWFCKLYLTVIRGTPVVV